MNPLINRLINVVLGAKLENVLFSEVIWHRLSHKMAMVTDNF